MKLARKWNRASRNREKPGQRAASLGKFPKRQWKKPERKWRRLAKSIQKPLMAASSFHRTTRDYLNTTSFQRTAASRSSIGLANQKRDSSEWGAPLWESTERALQSSWI